MPMIAAGVGLLVVCCSSSSAAMMMGGDDKEDPVVPKTPVKTDSGSDESDDDDSSADSSTQPETKLDEERKKISPNFAPIPANPLAVNAYKAKYRHEGVPSKYDGGELFHVTSIPGSDWREKETHCFNKCTDLSDCVLMTLKKDNKNKYVECWGRSEVGYENRSGPNGYMSYHKT